MSRSESFAAMLILIMLVASVASLTIVLRSREDMIADMQKDPEKYMTKEQIMFIRINDINKKLDVLIEKAGADKK